MRVSAGLFALTICMPAMAADIGNNGHIQFYSEDTGAPVATPTEHCPRTTGYFADSKDMYRGHKLVPRKLTELPPATTYMAVYRHIGDCEAPLTMTEYRNPRRR